MATKEFSSQFLIYFCVTKLTLAMSLICSLIFLSFPSVGLVTHHCKTLPGPIPSSLLFIPLLIFLPPSLWRKLLISSQRVYTELSLSSWAFISLHSYYAAFPSRPLFSAASFGLYHRAPGNLQRVTEQEGQSWQDHYFRSFGLLPDFDWNTWLFSKMGNYTWMYQRLQSPEDMEAQLVENPMFLNCQISSWECKMSENLILENQVPLRNQLKLQISRHPSSWSWEPWIQTWSQNLLPSAMV